MSVLQRSHGKLQSPRTASEEQTSRDSLDEPNVKTLCNLCGPIVGIQFEVLREPLRPLCKSRAGHISPLFPTVHPIPFHQTVPRLSDGTRCTIKRELITLFGPAVRP